jgi:hypothetical protein
MSTSAEVLSTPEHYRQLLDSVDTFLLDCDGVIYHGPVVVDGVKETLAMLRKMGEASVSIRIEQMRLKLETGNKTQAELGLT